MQTLHQERINNNLASLTKTQSSEISTVWSAHVCAAMFLHEQTFLVFSSFTCKTWSLVIQHSRLLLLFFSFFF